MAPPYEPHEEGLNSMTAGKNNILGFFVNLLSMMLFVSVDIIVKELTKSLPVVEVMFYRSFTGMPLLIIYVWYTRGIATLKMVNVKFQFIRMIIGVIGMFSFFTAYKNMPLAEAASILYTSPIILTVLSVLFFKERIMFHRTFALIIGFIGALLILRPGGEFNFYSLYALMGAIGWALVVLTMRHLSKTDNPYSVTFYFSVTGTVVGLTYILINGYTPVATTQQLILIFTVGIVGTLAQLFMTMAVELCDTALFASSKYLNLIFTAVAAYIVFNEVLSSQSILGMALIIIGGLYVVLREHILNKSKKINVVRF